MLAAPEIGLPVFVPKRTRVFPFLYLFYAMQRRPRAMRIGSRTHEQAFMRCAEKDPEFPVVVTYGRSPRSAGKTLVGIPFRVIESVIYLADDCPIDHIGRLQNGHTYVMEIRTNHIVFFSHPYYIGIGIVGIENRVHISAVTLVSPSGCLLGGSIRCCKQKQYSKQILFHDILFCFIGREQIYFFSFYPKTFTLFFPVSSKSLFFIFTKIFMIKTVIP